MVILENITIDTHNGIGQDQDLNHRKLDVPVLAIHYRH